MRQQLSTFAAVVFASGLAWACQRERDLFEPHTHRKPLAKRQETEQWPPVLNERETVIVNAFDNVTIDQWSEYYGHQNKLGGLGREAAEWTAARWNEHGFNAELNEYHVYLTYPLSASLHLTTADGARKEISLKEDVLEEDDVTGREDNQPTFHGYSASGNVTAEYVYVGRAGKEDFDRLIELGVNLTGKIALARYGAMFRGLKVKNAQDNGMIGCVIFSDPGDDGNVTVAKGVAAYPDGPARNPSSVQKGSVMFLSTAPGDPTTPGYPSHEGAPRTGISNVTPQIPSIPISYTAAQELLSALDGHGFTPSEVNRTRNGWQGAIQNVTYSTGPAPGVTLSLNNQMEGKITPIWNVIGRINGTIEDETVVIGNHRDTWMIGGNGDPNSGSAVLVELTKVFNELLKSGLKPRRNIILASWDAEEYGLVGSTEWVEDNIISLTETAVAYLNIDVAVSGPHPDIAATPDLHRVATETMKKVVHPNFGGFNRSLYDMWVDASGGGMVGVLGSGSDYTAFLHHGISSLDTGSSGHSGDPIWHYHSNYDSYHWMSTFGDPGFLVHAAMGQYLSLLALRLIDDEVLPFDLGNYAVELKAYRDDLAEFVQEAGQDFAGVDLSELNDAIAQFEQRTSEVKTLEMLAVSTNNTDLIKVVNHKYRDFQRGFVSQGGLPDRQFYKHVVMAPGLDTGYAAVTFPGITEGVQYANASVAQEWVRRTARGILRAADIIKT
ncbi:glutamate carboxypeptidase 2 [Pyricularia oryzae]|nr:glutamate carboxypeptidase 2 [Pyricularia oryzae]